MTGVCLSCLEKNLKMEKKEQKTFKLWIQVLWLKIKGTQFTHLWVWKGKTGGGILIKNYWSHWYIGLPFLLLDGSVDEQTGSWQFRFGFFGFVLVIFSKTNVRTI